LETNLESNWGGNKFAGAMAPRQICPTLRILF
jgi:hypothetical protein